MVSDTKDVHVLRPNPQVHLRQSKRYAEAALAQYNRKKKVCYEIYQISLQKKYALLYLYLGFLTCIVILLSLNFLSQITNFQFLESFKKWKFQTLYFREVLITIFHTKVLYKV